MSDKVRYVYNSLARTPNICFLIAREMSTVNFDVPGKEIRIRFCEH